MECEKFPNSCNGSEGCHVLFADLDLSCPCCERTETTQNGNAGLHRTFPEDPYGGFPKLGVPFLGVGLNNKDYSIFHMYNY